MTVFPINKLDILAYDVAILVFLGAQGKSPLMANTDAPGSEQRIQIARQVQGDQSIRQHDEATRADHAPFASYSFSSPEFRQSIKQISSSAPHEPGRLLAADMKVSPTSVGPEVPTLLKAPTLLPEVPTLLKAPILPGAGQEQPNGADQPVAPAVPIAPAEQMEDKIKSIDPCTKQVIEPIPAPKDMPKAMDLVKDRDPELFKQIQVKVTDPRYTGEMGNITVSTHDKKGRVNGCVFEQNVPYWESGPAAQALVDVNKELATKGKKLEADPLNGAGRSLAQEEAIVWRNSGLHAKVGKSNHGFGKAEDFKPDSNPDAKLQPWQDPFVNATLHAHGWRQGDSWGPLKNDLHHWSFVGPGPATDGHAPPHKPTHIKHHKHR